MSSSYLTRRNVISIEITSLTCKFLIPSVIIRVRIYIIQMPVIQYDMIQIVTCSAGNANCNSLSLQVEILWSQVNMLQWTLFITTFFIMSVEAAKICKITLNLHSLKQQFSFNVTLLGDKRRRCKEGWLYLGWILYDNPVKGEGSQTTLIGLVYQEKKSKSMNKRVIALFCVPNTSFFRIDTYFPLLTFFSWVRKC